MSSGASGQPPRLLPSWRPGRTRDAILAFLSASDELAPEDRVAVFDNDGTLWSEKPAYPQLAFFLHQLELAVVNEPVLAQREEYRALLARDDNAIASLGLPRIALALAELCAGMTAEEFTHRSASFLLEHEHPSLGRPFAQAVYQPMLELLGALRERGFATFIVSGGGIEFIRSISEQVYGVARECVVGTHIGYEYLTLNGAPALRRTGTIVGDANEGPAKVINIQQQLGRRPVFAAGNSVGDREMIQWALATPGPSLGLLIEHDDAAREFAYESVAGTFETKDSITDIGRREDWTLVSMREDWVTIFPDLQ